jgi:hypothetical protein
MLLLHLFTAAAVALVAQTFALLLVCSLLLLDVLLLVVCLRSRSLLQFAPGFPWPTADMRPTPSQCNSTGNSTIELFYSYSWPGNPTGPYCFKVWTNSSVSGSALGEITAPLNGQTDASASFVQLTALGFEVGECKAASSAGNDKSGVEPQHMLSERDELRHMWSKHDECKQLKHQCMCYRRWISICCQSMMSWYHVLHRLCRATHGQCVGST